MIQVDVNQQISTFIEGPKRYCIGDTLRLVAKTKEKDLKYLWLGPESLTKTDAI